MRFTRSAPQQELTMTAIIGWAHSKFGKLEAETLESLIAGIAR